MSTTIEKMEWNLMGDLAAKRLRDRGIHKYSDAQYKREFETVLHERAEAIEQRGHEVATYEANTAEASGVRHYSQVAHIAAYDLKTYGESGTTAKHRLARLLTAAKDSSTGKISTRLALEYLKIVPDDVMAAAGLRAEELVSQFLVNAEGAITPEVKANAMRQVLAKMPALAAAADYGTVSEELLHILFWPMSHVFE